jgi:hypothetical protein
MNACSDPTCERCPRIGRGQHCEPYCAGWFIDALGMIRTCDACGLFADNQTAAESVWELLQSVGHDASLEGWALFWTDRGPEIERDDEAGKHAYDDDDARLVATGYLGALTGCAVGPR